MHAGCAPKTACSSCPDSSGMMYHARRSDSSSHGVQTPSAYSDIVTGSVSQAKLRQAHKTKPRARESFGKDRRACARVPATNNPFAPLHPAFSAASTFRVADRKRTPAEIRNTLSAAAIETLEGRQMMSASIGLINGVLYAARRPFDSIAHVCPRRGQWH